MNENFQEKFDEIQDLNKMLDVVVVQKAQNKELSHETITDIKKYSNVTLNIGVRTGNKDFSRYL